MKVDPLRRCGKVDRVEYVIETRRLSKSLRVSKNSIFGFLGRNGAGKTTTLKLLLGLISPNSGGGSVFGMDFLEDSVQVRSRVGYLTQDTRFYEHLTACQTLRFTVGFFLGS